MSAVRRSLLFSGADRYVAQVLMVATTAVMARLLTPAETGLYLVASGVVLLAESFRDFGVGSYLVQAREVNSMLVRAAFTVTALLSVGIGGALALGSTAIADFYGDPDLARLVLWATPTFLFAPVGTVLLALLRRDLAFRALAGINIAAAAGNSAVTIACGAAGLGPISFVFGAIVYNALLAGLAYVARPTPVMFRPTTTGLRELVSFGMISAAVTVVNVAYDLLPRLAFGRMLGFASVGLYARALTVTQIPDRAVVSALQPVVLPAMAAHARAGGDLKRAYLRGHELMTAFQWPMLAMLALLADPFVHILLGAQWDEVPALVRPVAIGMMALAPAFMTYPVLVAAGRIKDTLTASLISLPPSVGIVIGAAHFGLPWVAASVLVVAPLQMAVALYFIRRAIGLETRELVRASAASAGLVLTTVAIPALVVLVSPHGLALGWAETAAALAGAALGWVAGLRLFRHPIAGEIGEVLKLVTGKWRATGGSLPPARSEV